MILIADSGSTKTDWCYGTSPADCRLVQTEGINPFHQDAERIRTIVEEELMPRLDFPPERCTEIYFYGAGCLPSRAESIMHALETFFPNARIDAETDLLGAARALCKDRKGIACILGTGSNSCLYDGARIVQNVPPLGYILGDEGSGAYLGKRFLGDCLKGQLPQVLSHGLMEYLNLDVPSLLDRIYRQPQPNRFLASVTPYIYAHKEMPQVQDFLADCFIRFFRRNVLLYPEKCPVSFVGSVAWYFHDEILLAAETLHLETGLFVKSPINELANFHFR